MLRNLVWAALIVPTLTNASELSVLAEAVYFEARSEPLACQVIVAQSIMNRVAQERFPDTVEGVVHQSKVVANGRRVCQYSYYCDGKPDTMSNIRSEITSYQVASMVLDGMVDLSEGADHYYAPDLANPYWSESLENSFTCGNHLFGTLNW